MEAIAGAGLARSEESVLPAQKRLDCRCKGSIASRRRKDACLDWADQRGLRGWKRRHIAGAETTGGNHVQI
jgi:hypothetical protein